jgi:ubiquitin conjugation factor E4 B
MARALRTNANALNTHLIRTHKVEDFLSFAVFTLKFLVHTGRIIDGQLPEKSLLPFAHLPEYLLGGIATTLASHPLWQIPDPGDLIRYYALLFARESYLKSPDVKASMITFFSAIAKDSRTRHLICGLPRVIDLVLPRLLRFYSSVQVTGTNATNFDRFTYRMVSSDVLITWFSIPDLQLFFIAQSSDKIYIEFIYYLVSDSLTFADESINLLKTIYTAVHEAPAQDGAENAEALAEVNAARTNLGYWVKAIDKALHLILCIVAFAPSVFHESIVLDSLTGLILCWMNAFVHQRDYFSTRTLQSVDLNPDTLLTSLMRIASAVGEDPVIVNGLVDNEMFPPAPLSAQLLEVARTRGIDGDVVSRFEGFASIVRERTSAMEADKIDISDAPEEFLDPLTYVLMKDPVRLPSGNVMDRDCVQRMLLTRPLDPWTTKPLKIDECVPDAELKARIEQYVAAKRRSK